MLIIVILLGIGFAVWQLTLNQNISPEDTSADVPDACYKLGINYAVYNVDDTYTDSNARAESLNLGYILLIGKWDGEQYSIADDFNDALDRGITPIFRICDSSSCPVYADPQDYINVLSAISDLTGGREFYAIAGPNEPMTEDWIPGLEGVAYPFTDQEIDLIGQKNAEYMNAVIAGVEALNKPNIKLLSPAFNTTHPDLERLITAMNAHNANFTALAGIAGNAYNLSGYSVGGQTRETISDFVDRLRNNGFADFDIFLTEIGMFEVDSNPSWTGTKVPRTQALLNLQNEIASLKNDPRVKAYLLFNSFGTNGDSLFDYNVMSDAEIEQIAGTECVGAGQTESPTLTPTILACGEQCSDNSECQNSGSVGGNVCTDLDNDGISTCVLLQCSSPTNGVICSPDGCAIGDPTESPTPSPTPTMCPVIDCQTGYVLQCVGIALPDECPTCECVLPSQTPTPTATFIIVDTDTPTPTVSQTSTPTPTATPLETATTTPSATATPTPSASPTLGPTVTTTPVSSPTQGPTGTIGPTLPSSALVSDEADRLIIALIMIVIAGLFLRLGLHQDVGQIFYNIVGERVFESKKYGKKAFEKRLIKRK